MVKISIWILTRTIEKCLYFEHHQASGTINSPIVGLFSMRVFIITADYR